MISKSSNRGIFTPSWEFLSEYYPDFRIRAIIKTDSPPQIRLTFSTSAICFARRKTMTTMSVAEYARDCAAQGLRGDYSV
ncbi:hypothetical protein EN947_33790, partial [Mesorhizobium sp. M7A.F.Ca.US.003.02.2.1]